MRPKLLLVGHMRHGKDTAAEFFRIHGGYTFESSSQAASRIFLYDVLKDKYGYSTPEECFRDRVNHRAEWFDLITDFNTPDKTRLAREIMKTNDTYVGMRSYKEIRECRASGVFDLVIGVHDPRKPLEDKSSFDIDVFTHSDFVIYNNGTLKDLEEKIKNIVGCLEI